MARLIKANSEEIEVIPRRGETFTPAELEEYVNGSLGMVGLDRGTRYWIIYNVEGDVSEQAYTTLPFNASATEFFNEGFNTEVDKLFGDIVVATNDEWTDELYHQYLEAQPEDEALYEDEPYEDNYMY